MTRLVKILTSRLAHSKRLIKASFIVSFPEVGGITVQKHKVQPSRQFNLPRIPETLKVRASAFALFIGRMGSGTCPLGQEVANEKRETKSRPGRPARRPQPLNTGASVLWIPRVPGPETRAQAGRPAPTTRQPTSPHTQPCPLPSWGN